MDQWDIDPAYHIEDYLIIKRPKEEDDKKPLLERTRKTCCDTYPAYYIEDCRNLKGPKDLYFIPI